MEIVIAKKQLIGVGGGGDHSNILLLQYKDKTSIGSSAYQ